MPPAASFLGKKLGKNLPQKRNSVAILGLQKMKIKRKKVRLSLWKFFGLPCFQGENCLNRIKERG